MEAFLALEAPLHSETALWVHLGASLACHDWHKEGQDWVRDEAVDARRRFILSSAGVADMSRRHFASIEGTALTGDAAAIGELREVHRAGYSRYAGMAGSHTFFHTPRDKAKTTEPDILLPVLAAFEGLIDEIAART